MTYAYTGKLADFSGSAFPNSQPRLWVEADAAAMSQSSLHATKRVRVALSANGQFTVNLVASADLSPPTQYVLRCEWLESDTVLGWTEWPFTARIGGGNIATMQDGAVTNVWLGADSPPVSRPGIIWIHPITGDVREWVEI